MGLTKVYFRGECYGLYGPGDFIQAIKGDGVVQCGQIYQIAAINPGTEACRNANEVTLVGVEGVFSKNIFKVTEACRKRMGQVFE
ncbi:MAG: hypothetical protein WCW30_00230 [Candidatus Gracilibacteria bacterium]